MNEYAATALAVLLSLGLGLFLLLQFGITFVSYLVVALILITILASLLYTWWEAKSDRTADKFKLEIFSNLKRHILALEEELKKVGELTDTQPFLGEIGRIKEKLVSKGYFDSELNTNEKRVEKKTLTQIEQEGRKIEQQLRSLSGLAVGSYREKVEELVSGYRENLELLEEAGFDIKEEHSDFERVSMVQAQSLSELIEKREKAEGLFGEAIERSIRECFHLASLAGEHGEDEELWKRLKELRGLPSHNEKLVELVGLKRELSKSVEVPFREKRTELGGFLESTLKILNREFIREEEVKPLKDVSERLSWVRDSSEMMELENLQKEARSAWLHSISQVSGRIGKLKKEMGGGRRSRIQMEELKKIDAFHELGIRVSETLRGLVDELESAYIGSKIASSYPKIESFISRMLREKNEITAEEIDVKYAASFLRKYAELHPNVQYRPGQEKLVNYP